MLRAIRVAFVDVAVFAGVLGFAPSASAWVYAEHREIALQGVQGLDPDHRVEFDQLWRDARATDEHRLCPQGADAAQGPAAECIDWAGLSGIAGDHSCSSREMLGTVVSSGWILQVADVAAQLKEDLARIPVTAPPGVSDRSVPDLNDTRRILADDASRAQRLNALKVADVRMQRADAGYATRASSNNAHFLLARRTNDLDPYAYADQALQPGSEISALGVYAWYHASALQKASRLAQGSLTTQQRQDLARSALFDEAFALHFLEDVYAAGHVAGSWGDASQRKGTHDYYNEHGLEVFTWAKGKSTVVLMGDAYMRPQDAQIAAAAVRTSLEQVLDAASGHSHERDANALPPAPELPDDFDVCGSAKIPVRPASLGPDGDFRPAFEQVIAQTPVPGLTAGLGAMPRFRAEIGPFLGLSSAIDGRVLAGGFEPSQTDNGFIAGVDVSLRAGMGLEGVVGDAGDGLVFAQLGYRATTPSTNKFSQNGHGQYTGSLTAAVPAEYGWSLRFRMPFYLVPGDLLFMSPLYLRDPEGYTKMAVTAANGGLIPWQLGQATRVGRFQFVLGRELGVTFYGLGGNQQLLSYGTPEDGILRIVNFKSIGYDIPILEYRPYRRFSTDQASSLLFQLFVNNEVPYDVTLENQPGVPTVRLDNVWSLGLRMTFTWRRYW
jgi:hypothetical protein